MERTITCLFMPMPRDYMIPSARSFCCHFQAEANTSSSFASAFQPQEEAPQEDCPARVVALEVEHEENGYHRGGDAEKVDVVEHHPLHQQERHEGGEPS